MQNTNLSSRQADQLVFIGAVLFFLGLLTGLLIPALANPRMALSSHLEGVMNGILLMVLGALWSKVQLDDKWLKFVFYLLLFGSFANWGGILFAAISDSGAMLNIAAEGKMGSVGEELIVNTLLISLSLAMLIAFVIIIKGLWNNLKQNNDHS